MEKLLPNLLGLGQCDKKSQIQKQEKVLLSIELK